MHTVRASDLESRVLTIASLVREERKLMWQGSGPAGLCADATRCRVWGLGFNGLCRQVYLLYGCVFLTDVSSLRVCLLYGYVFFTDVSLRVHSVVLHIASYILGVCG